MTAVQIVEYGPTEGLVLADSTGESEPGAGQILVKVAAAGINPVDTMITSGYFREMVPLNLPVTAGGDYSGVVEKVGAGVEGFAVGDRVIGHASVLMGGPGTFADYVVAPAGMAAAAPGTLDLVDAAALPLVGASALQALDTCRLSPGQTVLVLGGAGAVGSIAVQAAKAAGMTVLSSAGAYDREYLAGIGADFAFDYRDPSWLDGLAQIDAIVDATTGIEPEPYYAILKPGGVMVSLATQHDPERAQAAGVEATYQMTTPSADLFGRLVRLVDSGSVRQRISGRYPIEEVHAAIKAAGKNLVLL